MNPQNQVLTARFAGVPWQLCQFHLAQNALRYVPTLSMRREVARDLRGVLDASDLSEADRRLEQRADSAARLTARLEENVPKSLSVLGLPAAQRRPLRTTNMLERIYKELKRRTRVATLFPNEQSALRLAPAAVRKS